MLKNIWIIAPATMAMLSGSAGAQTLAEDFTKATVTGDWVAKGVPTLACLTAGTAANNTGITTPGPTYSTIGACGGTADAVGAGALRLTKATDSQSGSIVWNDTFPTNKGLQVTFTTYTYGGSGDGLAKQGADGISFFLMDGAVAPNIGSNGGSLGYSCSNSNTPYDGLEGAYLGLGMDEYGNFLNSPDNTATGIAVANASTRTPAPGNTHGENEFYSGATMQANRIGLRGKGNVSWRWLNANYSTYYKSSYSAAEKLTMVRQTCSTGKLQWKNGSGSIVTVPISGSVPDNTVADYKAITNGFWVLPPTQLISKTSAATRTGATPITYRLMITPGGMLNFSYSYGGGLYQPVLTNWDIRLDNGPLPTSFRFGFSASTGGANNVHEISCFVAEPLESTSSAGANTVQAGQVRTGTQIYLASFNPNNWTGSLVSTDLFTAGGVVTISKNYNWDLNCVLTGGLCASMGTVDGVPTHNITLETPATRTLLTYGASGGIPLQTARLTPAQTALLNSTDSGSVDRVDWLRGGRSKEQTATPPGLLRARGGVLGDIVDSSPTWVGAPSMGYGAVFKDVLYASTGTETPYTDFQTNMAMRQHVVYAGSNDGFLHGARAGSNNATGDYDATTNDGSEVIAYMPASALADTDIVDLTSPLYTHDYFVDAAPGTGDVFYGGAWHTWLVGGLGPGGKEIFALDVTDPTGTTNAAYAGVSFTEAHAPNIVKGSWTNANLANLGNTYGTPLVRRMHNGQWAIIFGNGIGNANFTGGIYIGLIDTTTGLVTFTYYSTGVGSSGTPNGITNVASGDLDGDHIADYLYAGDLLGNVWRFDVTSKNTADWAISKYGQPTATPLFKAKDSGGTAQPITTKIAVASVMTGGSRRVVLGFGTGKAVPFTQTVATSYAPGTQTIYGVWDWDMAAWNSGTTTVNGVTILGSASDFAFLAKVTASPYRTFSRTELDATALSATGTAINRELVINKVCWLGSTVCPVATDNTQYGWRFDLPDAGEQLIYNPIFTDGVLALNTSIPPSNAVGQCTPALPSGWTMAFRMDGGGGAAQNVFPDPLNSLVVAAGHNSIVGTKQDAVGTPYVVTLGSNRYVINQTIGGNPKASRLNPQGGVSVKRVSLEQLR